MNATPMRTSSGVHDDLSGTPVLVLELVEGFSLVGPSGPLPLPIAQQRLVAYLALAGRPTARRHLAFALWPDLIDERARSALRSSLYRLRHLVPGRVVEGIGDRIQMAPRVSCDVQQVLGWTERVLRGGLTPDDRSEPGAFGEILPGWDDDWVVLERERFRQRVLHAYEALAHWLVTEQRYADAVEAAFAAVAIDPLRESANRALIEAHLAEGNAAEALRHFDTFASRLSIELGLDPSPAISALVQGLRRSRSPITEEVRG